MSEMSTFPVNNALLNPKFDGYKLHALDVESSLTCHDLPPPGATQSTVSAGASAPLTFEEVQSRIRHNHLSSGTSNGTFAYVDSAGSLVVARIDPNTRNVSFAPIFDIPKEILSAGVSKVDNFSGEYPVPISLNDELWLVSDGRHSLYLISANATSHDAPNGTLTACYEYGRLSQSQMASPPLRLHAASLTHDSKRISAVVSHRAHDSDAESSSSGHGKSLKSQCDVVCISLIVPDHPSDGIQPAEARWRRRGHSIPLHVAYDPTSSIHLLLGGSEYSSPGKESNPNGAHEPSADEIAPIPRAGEDLDNGMVIDSTAVPRPTERPPPYSWTQTNDSVTVAFPLPASTPSSAIKVTIGATDLSLLVPQPILSQSSNPFPLPRFLAKQWWADVDASSSFWTWDKEGDRQKGEDGNPTVGLLTLHLEKKHEGTRWSHVFHSVGTQPASSALLDPGNVEVPETIDPSEMWHIRESLEKYTAELNEGQDRGGLGTGVSSLSQGEYDEEVDESAGIPIIVTWVNEGDGLANPQRSAGVGLLSMQLPRSGLSSQSVPSLVIKHDIDGLLMEPPSPICNAASWSHSSTYSAISFVLASKRDIRFTYHIDSRSVLAFEGSIRMVDAGGNAYVYRGVGGNTKARSAQQAVLKVGGGDAGTLLGVSSMTSTNASEVFVICLCERKIMLLSGIV
ncbi:hypothetical protein FRB93_001730 [Tulasnella sp. JGI-2019a]|nr:hypothetical protein FRB93_001730 [Tulasnella sp. JGI-2019a]